MSSGAASFTGGVSPVQRLETLFDEIAELTGQRNAIDARIVEIVAEMDRDGLCGATGARSIQAVVAWKTGIAPRNAETVVAVARRLEEFPRCAQGMREGAIAVYPVAGWWKSQRKYDQSDQGVDYSLVVSIESPHVDLWTPVAQQIATTVEIQT